MCIALGRTGFVGREEFEAQEFVERQCFSVSEGRRTNRQKAYEQPGPATLVSGLSEKMV